MMFSLVIYVSQPVNNLLPKNILCTCCLKYFDCLEYFCKNSYDLAVAEIVLNCALHLPIKPAICHGPYSLPHPERLVDKRWKSGIGQQTRFISGDGRTCRANIFYKKESTIFCQKEVIIFYHIQLGPWTCF